MPFQPFHIARWTRGATLVAEPDMIPDDALRRATNVRLDRTLGAIEVRPGWTARTSSAFASTVIYVSRLVASAATYSYAQFGTTLQRLNTSWGGATTLNAATGTQVLSAANSPDGNGNLLKYFVNGTIAIKDSGTVTTAMGVQPPTAQPTSAALAADLFTQIDEMSTSVLWNGTNLSVAIADDFTLYQSFPSSLSFSIAASTFGSIARDLGVGLNLDTLTGGDNLVKDDDYIHFWVRCDRPERVTFMQVDIDIDSATTGVADAFRRNYYHIRLGGLTTLDQGINSWTQVQIRKARFTRYGTDVARSWANARTFRIAFLTNTLGTVAFNIDDFKLRGGVGLEGDYEFTASYRNATTMARGNPPLDADRVILGTTKITTNRQRINLNITNVRSAVVLTGTTTVNASTTIIGTGTLFTTELAVGNQINVSSAPTIYATVLTIVSTTEITVSAALGNGTAQNITAHGANHPGDAQIDRLMLWCKGGIFPNYVLVDEIADTAASPYLMNTSEATLILTNQILETDNDIPPGGNTPPAGSTRVLFGPGGQGHLFMIADGYRLYFSKGYERLENRAENWGYRNFAIVGDGSARAVAGIATASQIRVWTTARTYNVVGIGTDTFLPVPIDGSRGAVSQFAVTEGHGILFFVSQDGIYADMNGRQEKITRAIDPFFEGRTVDGQVGWNTSQMALVELGFLNAATGSTLVMLYAEAGSATLNRFLVLKPNLQSGQLTECFFGTSTVTSLRSLFFDSLNRELLAGAANGHVYRIEDPSVYSDAGTAITINARTKSYDGGQPFQRKAYSSVLLEGNTTSQNATITAYYDRNATSEILTTAWATSAENAQTSFRTADETARRYNVALEISGSFSSRVAFVGASIHTFMRPDLRLIHDTHEIIFPTIHEIRKVLLDADAPAALTMITYLNGVNTNTRTVAATSGRQRVDIELPLTLRSKNFRVRWTSPTAFEIWDASGLFRPEPEDVFVWDSDEIYFEVPQQTKLFTLELDAPANLTAVLFVEGTTVSTRPIFATTGIQAVRHQLPPGIRGRVFRFNLTSQSRFQVWDMLGWFKSLGENAGWQRRPMTKRQESLVTRGFLQR